MSNTCKIGEIKVGKAGGVDATPKKNYTLGMVGDIIVTGIIIVGLFSMVLFFVDVQKNKLGTQTERDVLGMIGYFLAIVFGGGFLVVLLKAIF
jgi:hypothetical protein